MTAVVPGRGVGVAPPAVGDATPTRARSAVVATVGWLALAALAAAVRWPQLQMIPPYTDETEESLRAWAIYLGELRPLVNDEPYIGALWNYVVAGLFGLLGPNPELPRLAALAAGALTVGVTFLLGRRLYGDLAGVVAALLLAANGPHILVNSHVSWSNCATPLFTTLGFWLLLRALDRPRSLARFALAGLAWGLALQTHPSVVIILIGAGAYALVRDPRLPSRPTAWVAAACLLAAYANVAFHNLQSGFSGLAEAQRVGASYAGEGGLGPERYGRSLLGVLVLLAQVTAGVVDPRPTAAAYLLDPAVGVAVLALVAALGWSAWRRQWLLVLVAGPMLLLLPALNQRWQPILAARYLMPLLPLILVAVGGLVGEVVRRAAWRPPLAWGAVLAIVGLATAVQLVGLRDYYRAEITAGRTNDGPWQMIRLVQQQRRAREVLIVPAEARRLPTGGGGSWGRALNYLATVRDVPGTVARFDPTRPLRACDVRSVALWRVERGQAASPPPGARAGEGYWIIRHTPLPSERRTDPGTIVLESPYALPWEQRSLFDPTVPTFETGCEP